MSVVTTPVNTNTENKTILFRASSVGTLMVGGNRITDKQLEELNELQQRKTDAANGVEVKGLITPPLTDKQEEKLAELAARHHNHVNKIEVNGKIPKALTPKMKEATLELQQQKEDAANGVELKGIKVKPLTDKQEERLAELVEKRDAPFELSQSAKSYIEGVWLRKEFGYDEPVFTEVLMKGLLCEQDSIQLVHSVWSSSEFRVKNKQRFKNEFFTGCPDVILQSDGIVEDVKTCWTIKQFIQKKKIEPLYFAQLQAYMDLTGLRQARLHYCLVDTPEELIMEEEKRFYFKFGCDEENKHYLEACDKIRKNHMVSHIPKQSRIRTFEVEYDEAFVKELKSRVVHARAYYNGLSLETI